MFEGREGLESRDNGHRDPHRTATLHKVEVAAVVVEKLGHDVVGTGIDLRFEVAEVLLQRGGIAMLLGVACHTDGEGGAVCELHLAIHKLAPIHRHNLAHQLLGVGIPFGVGLKLFLAREGVTSQGQHVP